MGNSPMTIGLKVENPTGSGSGGRGRGGGYHVAGSILYGKVYLSVTEHEETATSIRLKVIGKENAAVHHTSTEERSDAGNGSRSSTSSRTRDHYEQSTHDIWNVDHPLKVFPNGKIPRGQYEFPFALQLPESLPSTMSSECGQSTCEVRYEVVAEVFKKSNSFMYSNPNAKEEINVAAKSALIMTPDQDTSLQLPLEIVPINRCCCFSCTKQGSIALETKFDKTTILLCPHNNSNTTTTTATTAATADTSYRSNENGSNQNAVMVQFRCQNKSTAKVGYVHVQLIETIDWHVNGHKETVRKILAESKKDAGLYPELDPLWRKPTRLERRRQQQQQQDDSEAHMLLQYKPWHAIGPLVVPSHAKDSYRGSGIQVRHVLNVQLKTSGWCTTNPDSSSSVEIYRNPMTMTTTAATTASTAMAMAMGVSYDDHLSCEQQQHTTPSAPFEDEFSSTTMSQQQATAPSDVYDYDNTPHGYNNKNSNTNNDFTSIPTVEAQIVLPEDWNAQTAEVVNIPMAEATVLP